MNTRRGRAFSSRLPSQGGPKPLHLPQPADQPVRSGDGWGRQLAGVVGKSVIESELPDDRAKAADAQFSIDTLRHLGMNLYSSPPPVLSDLVANAYDARAQRVDIMVSEQEVTIEDDGIGMGRG